MTLSKRIAAWGFAAALILGGGSYLHTHHPFHAHTPSGQTDVDRAEHLFDDDGVPLLKIADVGKQRHPAWIALYALAYSGTEAYDRRMENLQDSKKFAACIHWLEQNLKQNSLGHRVWEYDFDSTYNDISIKAPWSSAFAQATGIQALLSAYRIDGNRAHLDIALKAAQPLFQPIEKGGFLFQSGDDVWFEEIPAQAVNPSHILNGHMRVLLALRQLADATGDEAVKKWYELGANTLYRWLPRFDSGYWLRYDLNPKKQELLFRLANPYGFANHPLAVDRVAMRDPLSNQEVALDIGGSNDGVGTSRVAGTHWGQIEQLLGRNVRRLVPAAIESKADELAAPHSYFYLALPGDWKNNLRDQWYELVIDYYDDAPANLAVQMRSIAPGPAFRDMRDGDLHLTGAKRWRRWIIPLRPTDLGYWVGGSYAEKHSAYLEQLAQWDERFASWAKVAWGYLRLAQPIMAKENDIVEKKLPTLSKQTPPLGIYSMDQKGILMQHIADTTVHWQSDGSYRLIGGSGTPAYSPYIVAKQLLNAKKVPGADYSRIGERKIRRLPALNWLVSPKNYKRIGESAIYFYAFNSAYNDIATRAPWASAFGQANVLKSLAFAGKQGLRTDLGPHVLAVARAFDVNVKEGGVQSKDRAGRLFFEEVPNGTHVLNAHLISIPELAQVAFLFNADDVQSLVNSGIATLKEQMHLFDTGYWLRYDQNPRKELLIQLDWLQGGESPLLDEVLLQNPQTGRFARVDLGAEPDSLGSSRISGTEWGQARVVDGRSIRGFNIGYKRHAEPVAGGTRQNVYLALSLPEHEFEDFFDLPPHRLVIRYKDIAPGRFVVKTQAIHEGGHLEFVPLRGGVWQTVGDQHWKEASFLIRPQDMGWYKGPDYQRYEVEQLQRIANLTNDWFFYQYAERQRDYLNAQREGRSALIAADAAIVQPPIKLRLLAASPTYAGYGFENSIDGEPDDDYSAGIENQPGFVVLNLGRPSHLAALRFQWESVNNRAGHIVVSIPGNANSASKPLAELTSKAESVTQVNITSDVTTDVVRIDFGDFKGQPRLLLRRIEVVEGGKSVDGTMDVGSPFLGASDASNPLSVFRMPVTQRLKDISDKLSEGTYSDHEKILRFMDYIGQFRVGVASAATPDTAVLEQVGACGSFTNVLLALAAAQKIGGRYVNLHNYPKNDGHTVGELFVSGRWRLYDATYGAYYVPADESDRLPLGFDAIRSAYRATPASIKQVVRTYRPGLHRFASRDVFLQARPAGVIGPDRPMMFPLSLDLHDSPKLDRVKFGPVNQGSDYLGAASENQNQEWSLTGLTIGDDYVFTLAPKHIGGDLQPADRLFKLRVDIEGGTLYTTSDHVFDFSRGSADAWRIHFKASTPEVRLRLTHSYRGPDFRYMQMERYALEEAKGMDK